MSENAFHTPAPELLLVDDNDLQASTRRAILVRAGIRVAVCANSGEALQIVEHPEIRQSLRVVITDHLMPEMNGPELVARLREVLPEIPVLVLSGLPGAESEYDQLNVCFRLKPFPPEELIRTVKQMMNGAIQRSA